MLTWPKCHLHLIYHISLRGEKNAAKASLPTPTQGRPGSAQPQMETCMCTRNCTERPSWERIYLLCHIACLSIVMPPVMGGSSEGSKESWKAPVCPLQFLRWGMYTKCPSIRSTDFFCRKPLDYYGFMLHSWYCWSWSWRWTAASDFGEWAFSCANLSEVEGSKTKIFFREHVLSCCRKFQVIF